MENTAVKENPGALAGATGASFLSTHGYDEDNTSLARRHPVIALHWGTAA